jgi:hypothetical protein
MMRYADWGRPTKNNKDARLSVEHIPNKVYEPNKCRLRSANTWVEKLAIDWCLNYWYAFFEDAKDEVYPWVLTTYEALVTKGEIEFKRIREALRIDEAEGPVRMLRRASSTVSRNADVSDSKQQISKWKRNLSNTQIDRILDIVDIFGMNFYDRSSEPLYDKVYQYQCSSHG